MAVLRKRLLIGALTLLSCSCRTLSFVPLKPYIVSTTDRTVRVRQHHHHLQKQRSYCDRSLSRRDHTPSVRAACVGFGRHSRSPSSSSINSASTALFMTEAASVTTDSDTTNSSDSDSITSNSDGSSIDSSDINSSSSISSNAGSGGDAAVETAEDSSSSPPPAADATPSSTADVETALTLDKALEEGINRALCGDPDVLRQVLAEGAEWRGPLGQNVGLPKIEAELRGLGQLLGEPRITTISLKNGAKELDWIASGTWPLPWLPRYIVRGKSDIEMGPDGKVAKILDKWDGNLISLAFKHLVPGFWDIWHQLGSPPAEKQPYKVLKRTFGYEVREYAPRLVIQPSLVDRSGSREIRKALILPGFCHTGDLRFSGRKPDEYYVTEPIEVAIQPFIETGDFPAGTWFNGTVRAASTSRRVNRITWTVPVPTALGLDPTVLQAVAKERELGESQNSRHARQGFRRVAVTNFNGLPQDPEAADVRAKLLKQIVADGFVPNKGKDGRVRNGIFMHNSRSCFTKRGEIAMSILYYRPPIIGIGNEVYVELDDEEVVTEAVVDE